MKKKIQKKTLQKSVSLRTGWTTGACAAAATKAAMTALVGGIFPNPVSITLPGGQCPSFRLTEAILEKNCAIAALIKDAGDDPDVTHGATIIAKVCPSKVGKGVIFQAGEGVGTVTRPGLPVCVGEAAINPIPRQMIQNVIWEICEQYHYPANIMVTLSIPNGEKIARKSWNPRLGIVGGLSILGTTGIVRPFSCSAWIHSLQRGIDVARAAGQRHLVAATGSTSETAAKMLYSLPELAILDMGNFVGAVLKYLRHYPVERLTLCGGFAKFCKLAQGALNLHSNNSQIDKFFLWSLARNSGLPHSLKEEVLTANTAKQILDIALCHNIDLAISIALKVQEKALNFLHGTATMIEVIVTDRTGKILARVGEKRKWVSKSSNTKIIGSVS